MAQKNKRNRFPAVLMALGGLLLIGAAIVLALQLWPGSAGTPTPEALVAPEDLGADIPRVSLEEARAAFDEGKAVFVDVRGPAAYEAGRIPGALLIPLKDLESRWNELDPEAWIIPYCT